MLGITFMSDDKITLNKHTSTDWNLKWYDIKLEFPTAKTHLVNIPGANGVIDLTQSLDGDVKYNQRSISLYFDYLGDFYEWSIISSEIANTLHGQQLRIVLDIDPGYYYLGRLSISTTKSNIASGQLVLEGTVDPYKYELTNSLEDWLWDPFNFETGVIREYGDMLVNGTLEFEIYGNRMWYIPTFITDTTMKLEFNGVIYELPKGESKNLDIVIKPGINILKFTGNGSVSIDYKGGSL